MLPAPLLDIRAPDTLLPPGTGPPPPQGWGFQSSPSTSGGAGEGGSQGPPGRHADMDPHACPPFQMALQCSRCSSKHTCLRLLIPLVPAEHIQPAHHWPASLPSNLFCHFLPCFPAPAGARPTYKSHANSGYLVPDQAHFPERRGCLYHDLII